MVQEIDHRSVAVFIDVENIHYSTVNEYGDSPDWARIVDLCKQQGRISSIQAFGDWRNEFADDVEKMQRSGIQVKFVPRGRQGKKSKSSLDSYLIVSAMTLFFQHPNIKTLILASGDRDYIPMIDELRAMGITVIILAIKNTLSADLEMVVDKVIFYESLKIRSDVSEASIEAHKMPKDICIDFVKRELQILEKSADDGWINLAFLGLLLKKKNADFSHKALGYNKLIDLLGDIEAIEIKYSEDGLTAFAKTKIP